MERYYTNEGNMMKLAGGINLKLVQPNEIQWDFYNCLLYGNCDGQTIIKAVLYWLLPCIQSKANKLTVLDCMIIELNQCKTYDFTHDKDYIEMGFTTAQDIDNLLEAFKEARERVKAEPEATKQSVIAEANPPEAEQKQVEQKQGQKVIPPEFQTPKAKQVFQWLIEKGIVDKEYMPTDKVKTKSLKTYLAKEINIKATMAKHPYINRSKLKYCWKPFQDLWKIKDMAKIYQDDPSPIGSEIVDNALIGFKLLPQNKDR